MSSTPARSVSLAAAVLAAVVASGALVAGGLVTAPPASAAGAEHTIDRVIYRIDPDDPGRGATVLGATANLSFEELPASIEVGGQSYVVTEIGDEAFADSGLNRLGLPDGLVRIGDRAFADNPLIAVDIPASVREIGAGAYAGGDRLYEATLHGPAPELVPAGAGESFSSAMTTLRIPWALSVEAGVADGYETPEWRGYDTVADVTVAFDTGDHGTAPAPEVVEQGFSYYAPWPDNDGEWWFLGWFTDAALTEPFDEGAPIRTDLTLHAAWGRAHVEAGMTFVANPARPAEGARLVAYDPGAGGTDPVIPSAVTIGGEGFEVREIADSAFSYTGLTSVRIPSTVTTLGPYAFSGNELEEIELPAGLETMEYGAFWANRIRAVVIPEGITVVRTRAFLENELESVVIPEGVAQIQSDAFGDNALREVALPGTLTRILGSAFADNLLTEVTIPASVTSLGTGVFDRNPGLESVVLLGPPPTVSRAGTFDETFDTASGRLVLDVPWRHTAEGSDPAGYTVPTWNRYSTRAIATVGLDTAGGEARADLRVPVGSDLAAPSAPTRAGFSFTGWLRDGEPASFPLAIDGDLVLTAGWEALAPAVASLELRAEADRVPQGGTLRFEAIARDADGARVEVDEADIRLVSDVPSDVVEGLSVTFPHASPHTLTATHLPSGAEASLTVEVVPAAAPGAAALPDMGAAFPLAVGLAAAGALLLGLLAVGARARSRRSGIS